MATLRTGKYGSYYGSYYDASTPLTSSEMETNALYIYKALVAAGWTLNAISGILGNMVHESSLNPGRWQRDNVGNMSSGYSLVQWTPATNYTDWCAAQGRDDPSEMDNALDRILYELENGLQYYATSGYPESFREFSQSTASPYYLAGAFAWNYERSWTVLYGSESEKEALRQRRGGEAEQWYTFLSGETPPTPDEPDEPGTILRPHRMSLLLLIAASRRRG